MLLLEKLPNIHLTFRMGESEVLWPLSTWQGFELSLSASLSSLSNFLHHILDYSRLLWPQQPRRPQSSCSGILDYDRGIRRKQWPFQLELDLRTIRESPETVYTVSYMETTSTAAGELDEGAVLVPPVEPAVPGVSIVELSGSESGEEDLDLRRLNERADKLSKELKELNSQALKDNENDDDADESTSPHPGDFKEIMRQYSDFIIIIRSDETGTEETIDHTDLSTLLMEEEAEKEVANHDDLEELDKKNNDDKVLEVDDQITQDDSPTTTELLTQVKDSLPESEEMSQDQVTKTDEDNDDTKALAMEKEEVEAEDQETKTDDDNDDTKALPMEKEQVEAEDQKTKNDDDNDDQKKAVATEKVKVEAAENQEELESLLHQLEHFKPQRPQVPQPQFPDLELEGETSLRQKCHGQGHFWRMPFRHHLFSQQTDSQGAGIYGNEDAMVSWYLRGCDPNQDAFRFTPSGDIYAYFERRPPPPIARFSPSPLNYQMTKAMGGPSRKNLKA